MTSPLRSGSVSLKHERKRKARRGLDVIEYDRCIICQGADTRNMLNVTSGSLQKLQVVITERCDDTAKRLKSVVTKDTWLHESTPKWHRSCRSRYLLKKSVSLAKRKRCDNISQGAHSDEIAGPSYVASPAKTRSQVPQYRAQSMCVICNKVWHKGKKPISRITTQNREDKIKAKAIQLNRNDILRRLTGKGHDMVSNDICYHKHCMDVFNNTRITSGKSQLQGLYDQAFDELVPQIDDMVFNKSKGILLSALRSIYQKHLANLGIAGKWQYKFSRLRERLIKCYGARISIMEQSNGSAFVCASNVPVGDCLEQLKALQKNEECDRKEMNRRVVAEAATILRNDAKDCKRKIKESESMEISNESASAIVPDSFYNFTSHLLSDKAKSVSNSNRVDLEQHKQCQALMLSQQMLHHTAGIQTPLSIGTTYSLYNETRSKSLIKLTNKLKQGIGYDTLQRQLTAKATAIQQSIEENGVYVPENMTAVDNYHVFAMDNLDWQNNTLSGGSFNATSAIIIETPKRTDENIAEDTVHVKTSVSRARSMNDVSAESIPACFVSKKERRESRSLTHIQALDNLETGTDTTFASNLLLIWKLCRLSITTGLPELSIDEGAMHPGYPEFCARLSEQKKANKIGYLPLIPESPTSPAVLKEEMSRIVKTSHALGHEWTIVTGDQATYELATVLRQKHSDVFGKVVLLLGGFHQAHNFLKAICRIIQGSGAEELIALAGICSEGTANKIVGDKGDYYQTLHAVRVLNEAFTHLHWCAFETWAHENNKLFWNSHLAEVIMSIVDNDVGVDEQLHLITDIQSDLEDLRRSLDEFNESLQMYPTAVFWLTFLKMSDIIQEFLYYQREGGWLGTIQKSVDMLPYMAAAGHHKYAQQSLPLFIQEMKELPATAPDVHAALMDGAFVGRRRDGSHNAVSPDMLLEQTYNADAKERAGLTSITANESARTKWVYTKHCTAAVSSQLKEMIDLDVHTADGVHHESSPAQVARNREQVLKMTESVEENPFASRSKNLFNIVTGERAQPDVQSDLTNLKEIGRKAIDFVIEGNDRKVVKLKTFYSQNKKGKKSKAKQTGKQSDEMATMLRMTQLISSGVEVDVISTVGSYECSEFPPSLFYDDGRMRVQGTKSSLVTVLLKETNVSPESQLPDGDLNTAIVVDAMHAINKWSFSKGDSFGDISDRYLHQLLCDVPIASQCIHLCCDRYRDNSLKSAMRQVRRNDSQRCKCYEVRRNYSAPEANEFFASGQNKAALLNFLCDEWSSRPLSQSHMHLYLGGGFTDEKKSVLVTNESVSHVPELASTQEEADTRVVLHAMHAARNGAERVVVHANDTDIIILCIYYFSTDRLEPLKELWVRTEYATYLPIHKLAIALGQTLCQGLPFIHSLSGRDTTSYPYFTGKKAWFEALKSTDTHAIEQLGEGDTDVCEDVFTEARHLCIKVYSTQHDDFDDIANLRAHKFLRQKSSALLRLLPPTDDSFVQHVKRCALATITDKRAHLAEPDIPPCKHFGWSVENAEQTPQPVYSTQNHWPELMTHSLSCKCKTGCKSKNCSCSRRGVRCYVGCRCTGRRDKCTRFQDSDSESGHD